MRRRIAPPGLGGRRPPPAPRPPPGARVRRVLRPRAFRGGARPPPRRLSRYAAVSRLRFVRGLLPTPAKKGGNRARDGSKVADTVPSVHSLRRRFAATLRSWATAHTRQGSAGAVRVSGTRTPVGRAGTRNASRSITRYAAVSRLRIVRGLLPTPAKARQSSLATPPFRGSASFVGYCPHPLNLGGYKAPLGAPSGRFLSPSAGVCAPAPPSSGALAPAVVWPCSRRGAALVASSLQASTPSPRRALPLRFGVPLKPAIRRCTFITLRRLRFRVRRIERLHPLRLCPWLGVHALGPQFPQGCRPRFATLAPFGLRGQRSRATPSAFFSATRGNLHSLPLPSTGR